MGPACAVHVIAGPVMCGDVAGGVRSLPVPANDWPAHLDRLRFLSLTFTTSLLAFICTLASPLGIVRGDLALGGEAT